MAGILFVIIGMGVMLFIMYDFITSLIKGRSQASKGLTASNYGPLAFIILALGFALEGGGLMLLGVIKQ